ncbi:YdcF family protein [Candidatus Uhrbacteria bacterium]|nr:YdcF family protein [Candidatus Uhrbacteria bacterium]
MTFPSWFRRLAAIGLLAGAVITTMVADVQLRYRHAIFSIHGDAISEAAQADAAIVLGASVRSDKTPSAALRDRLETAAAIYRRNAVKTLFVTGDDGRYHVDEMSVMVPYLVQQGIPETAMPVDGQGYRTYESCKHAAARGIRTAIVVTQRFHLGRALYLCNRLGVQAVGVDAGEDRTSNYEDINYFWIREVFASVKAWWDVNVLPPKPPV